MKLKDLIPQSMLPDIEADAIAFLRADHDKIEDLFSTFDEIKYGRADEDKKRLVGELCREIRMHGTIEEELFYPAVRAEIADDDLMNEASVEHEGIRRLVDELESMDPADEMLNAKMHVLDIYVTHHVREEEENIFPRARESELDLAELAGRLSRRKSVLLRETADARPRADRRTRSRRAAASEPRASR
jgi:hemerythrin superfamily protein